MTFAPVVPANAFKKCCLGTGQFDGSNRDNYFPRVDSNGVLQPGAPHFHAVLPNHSLQLTGRPPRDRRRQPGTMSVVRADRRHQPAAELNR